MRQTILAALTAASFPERSYALTPVLGPGSSRPPFFGPPESKKARHLEPEAGHYGIFAGKSWRLNIRPLVLGFIDKHSDLTPDAVVMPLRRPKAV